VLKAIDEEEFLGFAYETDAQQILAEMRKRSKAFSRSVHPEEIRILRFGRFAARNWKEGGLG